VADRLFEQQVVLLLGIRRKDRKKTYLFTYLLTPWCRVLLEQLTGLQIVKKFPAFHGTRRFITAFTSVRHLSLSWASPIQFIYPHPTSWRSVLILSTHLRLGLPSGLLPSGFPNIENNIGKNYIKMNVIDRVRGTFSFILTTNKKPNYVSNSNALNFVLERRRR